MGSGASVPVGSSAHDVATQLATLGKEYEPYAKRIDEDGIVNGEYLQTISDEELSKLFSEFGVTADQKVELEPRIQMVKSNAPNSAPWDHSGHALDGKESGSASSAPPRELDISGISKAKKSAHAIRPKEIRRNTTVRGGLHAGSKFTFWLLPRDFVIQHVKQNPGKPLPVYQKLRAQGVLVAVQFTVEEAMNGKYHESIGAASYTWAAAGDPDPTGEKLAAHAIFLEQNPDVQYHFIDFNCIPQNYVDDDGKAVKRTDEEQQYFDEILTGGGLNCLYFFVRVSSVVNESYLERFWPQFEFFLATREFAPRHGKSSQVLLFKSGIRSLCPFICSI
jgi:hypothetical protein